MEDALNDFAATQKAISDALVSTIRAAAAIAAEDVPFHRSSDPSKIGPLIEKSTSRILRLTEQLVSRARPSKQTSRPLSLSDVEDIDICWEQVVDVADALLERTDTCLDEYTGLIKSKDIANGFQNSTRTGIAHKVPFRDAVIPKPQLQFETKPDNNASTPFRPLLTSKPHSRGPFDQSFSTVPTGEGDHDHQHPYETEIREYQFPPATYTKASPIDYEPFEMTTATFVDTIEGVELMLEELKKSKEIAIDLEHHDSHSYIGLVSLMQISTRDQDWIIDTLKPWRWRLEMLNEVLADPSVLKVLHGAQMDIIWLQRDLGLYIVGLFDTYHASRVLGYPRGSLAFLLETFTGFEAQKQYQTADWRIRPLPEAMFEYARSDTHFLLYVYDCMRNELVEKSNFNEVTQDRISEVLARSKETALQRYEHSFYTDDMKLSRNGWFSTLLSRFDPNMSQLQISVFAKVHRWRDEVARHEDESLHYIMPNHILFNIAQSVPEDETSIRSLLPKATSILQARLHELLLVIAKAKNEADQAPTLQDVLARSPSHVQKEGLWELERARASKVENKPLASMESVYSKLKPCSKAQWSEFWGPSLDDGLISKKDVRVSNRMPRLVVPLSAHILRSSGSSSNSQIDVSSSAFGEIDPHWAHIEEQSTVSGMRKRKLNESESDNTAQVGSTLTKMEMPRDHQSPEAIASVRRRAEKKAAKRARHEPGSAPESSPDGGGAGAFDYEKAPSVLNSRRTVSQLQRVSRASFDPFAKATEAPAGLKKSKPSKVGKSQTSK
ncbi:MAG: exosome nuclease subunit [Alyxoria varia]|nr:MAG: exosome nuclease subunit [Alyxoria varia]